MEIKAWIPPASEAPDPLTTHVASSIACQIAVLHFHFGGDSFVADGRRDDASIDFSLFPPPLGRWCLGEGIRVL